MGMIVAGSQKGSMLLAEIRKKYPNYHPIMAIVDIAHEDGATAELRFNCHKTVAKYVEPELKSIEVKGDFREQHTVKISLFSDEVETVSFTDTPFASSSDVDAALLQYEQS